MAFRKRKKSRIGRLSERQYQLTVQKRNEAEIKFESYNQTARYFARETDKAKQFNAWTVDPLKPSKHLEIIRKAESLRSRQANLKALLKKDEEIYQNEYQKSKTCNSRRVHFSLESLQKKLLEKRAEESLYIPRSCRRIQSYLYGPYSTRSENRPILRELNESVTRKSPKIHKKMEKNSTDLWDRNTVIADDENHSVIGDHRDEGQQAYDQRMEQYKENHRCAQASHFYGPPDETEIRRQPEKVAYEYKAAAGLPTEPAETRPHMRKLHDSHFLLGNQTLLNEGNANHKAPNQKFQERYGNRSLEMTNVGETAAHSLEEENPSGEAQENVDDGELNDEVSETQEDQVDHQVDFDQDINEIDPQSSSSMKKNGSVISNQSQEEIDEQRDIDHEVGAKATAGKSDHRHFETEKSLPWMRMVPGDKNLSEQMFLYLTHIELKTQIQDLEKRENQACSKHQWDEALRLRDMRNRLDLARERNLYRRDDLLLDPELKKLGMAAIESRSKLLKEREEDCANPSMYSEEAKIMWDQWVIEDKKSVFEDARLQREDLMQQLEANWRSLAIDDKQRITDSFHKDFNKDDFIDVAHGQNRTNSGAFVPANRH